MHQLGMLPLADLRLDAPQFRSLPGCACALATGGANQLTNGGVKALVDAVCGRWLAGRFRPVLPRAGAVPAVSIGTHGCRFPRSLVVELLCHRCDIYSFPVTVAGAQHAKECEQS